MLRNTAAYSMIVLEDNFAGQINLYRQGKGSD